MITATIKETFYCDKNELWDAVTNLKRYQWRSDLAKIDVIDETHFIEYTKKNYPTYFTITSKKKVKEYQFDLENTNMKGSWIGLFHENKDGSIDLEFTEKIEVKHWMMKWLAKPYLKSQQKRYMKDLHKELDLRHE